MEFLNSERSYTELLYVYSQCELKINSLHLFGDFMGQIDKTIDFIAIRIAVLTVSDTRSMDDDRS